MSSSTHFAGQDDTENLLPKTTPSTEENIVPSTTQPFRIIPLAQLKIRTKPTENGANGGGRRFFSVVQQRIGSSKEESSSADDKKPLQSPPVSSLSRQLQNCTRRVKNTLNTLYPSRSSKIKAKEIIKNGNERYQILDIKSADRFVRTISTGKNLETMDRWIIYTSLSVNEHEEHFLNLVDDEKQEYIPRVHQSFEYRQYHHLILEPFDIDLLKAMEIHSRWKDVTNISLLAERLLHGLQFLHSKHIVHGNLCPQNIVFSNQDISDAKLIGYESWFTPTKDDQYPQGANYSWVMGDEYVAPERLLHTSASFPSDLWSLGIVLLSASDPYPDCDHHYLETLRSIEGVQSIIGKIPFYMLEKAQKNGSDDSFFQTILARNHYVPERAAFLPSRVEVPFVTRRIQSPDEAFRIQFTLVDFLMGLLTVDPHLRMTIDEALRHPFVTKAWFTPLRSAELEEKYNAMIREKNRRPDTPQDVRVFNVPKNLSVTLKGQVSRGRVRVHRSNAPGLGSVKVALKVKSSSNASQVAHSLPFVIEEGDDTRLTLNMSDLTLANSDCIDLDMDVILPLDATAIDLELSNMSIDVISSLDGVGSVRMKTSNAAIIWAIQAGWKGESLVLETNNNFIYAFGNLACEKTLSIINECGDIRLFDVSAKELIDIRSSHGLVQISSVLSDNLVKIMTTDNQLQADRIEAESVVLTAYNCPTVAPYIHAKSIKSYAENGQIKCDIYADPDVKVDVTSNNAPVTVNMMQKFSGCFSVSTSESDMADINCKDLLQLQFDDRKDHNKMGQSGKGEGIINIKTSNSPATLFFMLPQ